MTEPTSHPARSAPAQAPVTRAEEIKAFLLLTAIVAPLLAIGIVAGYGFFVWMYQLLTGTLPGA